MHSIRCLLLLGFATVFVACGGGGGGQPAGLAAAPWGQFRHDANRTGGSTGFVGGNRAFVSFAAIDDRDSGVALGAVSASPVIDFDGTVYVGSEGGTLRALQRTDLRTKWSIATCPACCVGDAPAAGCDDRLGPLVASAALRRTRTTTTVVLGDTHGRVYRFTVDETADDPSPVCDVCFEPDLSPDAGPAARTSFRSSAALTSTAVTGELATIYVGSEVALAGGGNADAGKFYALNSDGSIRWQFPRRGDGFIGPVTSSPTLGLGGSVVVAAGDDSVYVLDRNGALRRQISVADLTAPDAPLQPSIAASASLFVGTARGEIYAFNHDGTFRWVSRFPGRRFLGSLAIGAQLEPTPIPVVGTPTPTATLAPDDPTPTATPTPTPVSLFSTVMGVTADGELAFVAAATGAPLPPTGTTVDLPGDAIVLASPALSVDGFIVFADTGGQLHIIDTANGESPRFCEESSGVRCSSDDDCGDDDRCGAPVWPVALPARCRGGANPGAFCSDDALCGGGTCAPAAIRSSPAIDNDGTIYVGADDGFLYALSATASTPTPTVETSATAVGAPGES